MPVLDAIITDTIILSPEQTVSEALAVLRDKGLRVAPVVDDNRGFLGIFSIKVIMDNLLPVSVRMDHGLAGLGFMQGSAMGVAKKYKKLLPMKVGEVMRTDCHVLKPDTPLWEGARLMTIHGSPLPVIDDNNKLVGVLAGQSLLFHLEDLIQEIDSEEDAA